jgi:diguanylate cyclase (GGDEF)-like protein
MNQVDLARSIAASLSAEDAAIAGLALKMLDRAAALVAIKDVSTGRYVHVNVPMAALFGRSAEAMVGATDADLMDTAEAAAMRAAETAALAQETPTPSDHKLDRQGQRRDFSVTRIAVPRADGAAPRHVMSMWLEVTALNQRETQLQQALAQLEQQQLAVETLRRESQDHSLRDGVTGLYQRLHFDDQLRREVDLSSREHREFALVSIALDPPSESVRLLGEIAHTRTLEALGRLLRSNTRAMDASCRLDEDHFAVLLSGVGLATAHSRMEGLRRQCATQIVVLDGRDIGFTVSMGVASFPHTAHSEEELLKAADLALAEAQRRGGNHVTLASIRFELGA